MVGIEFEFETEYGMYRDALWLPDNHEYTEAEIDEMKLARVENWINLIENPPVPPEETGDTKISA